MNNIKLKKNQNPHEFHLRNIDDVYDTIDQKNIHAKISNFSKWNNLL